MEAEVGVGPDEAEQILAVTGGGLMVVRGRLGSVGAERGDDQGEGDDVVPLAPTLFDLDRHLPYLPFFTSANHGKPHLATARLEEIHSLERVSTKSFSTHGELNRRTRTFSTSDQFEGALAFIGNAEIPPRSFSSYSKPLHVKTFLLASRPEA